MAKKPRPKPEHLLNQLTFDIPPSAKAAPEGPVFLPPVPAGRLVIRHVEITPAEFRILLDRSVTLSKDRGGKSAEAVEPEDGDEPEEKSEVDRKEEMRELKALESFTRDMVGEAWIANGDTMILDPRGAILEGVKRALAAERAGTVLRILVVQGVDPEARFSTDDTLKSGRARRVAPDAPTASVAAEPVDLAAITPRDREAVAEALRLRDRLSAELGYPVLAGWTAESLAASALRSGVAAGLGERRHRAIAAHALVAEVAPNHVDRFMREWALSALSRTSTATLLARSPLRPAGGEDDLDFLAALALAIESLTDGQADDPYALRAATRRSRRQLLQVLAGRPGHRPDRLVSCAEETIDVPTLRRMLAEAGRPEGSWDPEEVRRIAPLVRDVVRRRGLVLTGQSIKVSAGGRLLDGFDRAVACVIADRPYHGVVARGFREDFDPVRTQGRKQSLGHRLYADGVISPYDLPSQLANIHRMDQDDRGAQVTNTFLRHLHRKHPQAARSVMFVHDLKPLVKKSLVSTVHLAMSRYSRDLADGFCTELYEIWKGLLPVTEPRHRTLRTLVPILQEIHADRKGRDDDLTLCILIQAINAWCREEEVATFGGLPATGVVRIPKPPQIARMERDVAKRRAA